MYRALRAEVEEVLTSTLEAEGLPADDLGLEEPPDDVDAILASSVAFRLAGTVGDAPPAVAEQLASAIETADATYIGKIRAQGPYLNVEASQTYYRDTLDSARRPDYGHLESTDTRIVVEHTSANPTGPVHMGRARNPITGDAIARLLELAGHDVDRHYYVNDAGRQVAVFTWAYETLDEAELPEPERDKPDYDLVRYYRAGNAYLEEADPADVEAAEEEITAIMQGLEEADPATLERVHTVVDQVLDGMRQTLERLPARFDEFIKETRFLENNATKAITERLKASPQAEQDEGAWQLRLEEWDIDKPLIFRRSDGTSLYATRDIAHHEWKLDTYDRAVTVLGEDHKLQAKQVRAALEILGNETERIDVIHHSWVNLPGGEGMSTRKGTGIDLDDLLDEAIERAQEEVENRLDERIRDDVLDEDDIDRIAHQVGIGAVRYDMVSKQPTKAITFDWDRALDFEAQSAPYLQYVHARACGIIAEADETLPEGVVTDSLSHSAERALLEEIARFPAVIESAADDLEPHVVATYARTFAETFNTFYRECPVLHPDVPTDVRDARLSLVVAARNTIGNTLEVLGIAAPDSM